MKGGYHTPIADSALFNIEQYGNNFLASKRNDAHFRESGASNAGNYHTMNRRVLFHDCPILDRSPSRGALRFKVVEDSGGGVPATTSKGYLPRNAFAASWAAPIQARMLRTDKRRGMAANGQELEDSGEAA
jgi:hypothetical protein